MADRATELDRPLDPTPRADVSRRVMLRCAALCGLAVPVLAACGSDDAGSADGGTAATPGSASPSGRSTPESAGGGDGQAGAEGLVATADVPVGGGVVLAEAGVVVTQPSKGDFKGFSSTCTHKGSTLSSVQNGVISCPQHGSQFAIEDGANVAGPNGEAAGSVPDLPTVAVEVQGGQVVRA
jgi:nitrite reductase/ring-hydroxylating ferredoxin subunit